MVQQNSVPSTRLWSAPPPLGQGSIPLAGGPPPMAASPMKPSGAVPGEDAAWDLPSISEPNPILRIEGGGTRKTYGFRNVQKEVVQLALASEGRPIQADMELWIGPDWTPFKLKAYSEDGLIRPVQTLIGTRNKQATIEIRNAGAYEFPFNAACRYADPPLADARTNLVPSMGAPRLIQGGAVYSVPFEPTAERVRVLLRTDGRQLNARIELLAGPNNIKQLYEVFTNNGQLNSLYVVFDTPGAGNVVRIVNQGTVEFPAYAYISSV